MPFCQHCGAASVESEQRFCQACGQALASPPQAPAAPAAPVSPPAPASDPTATAAFAAIPPTGPGDLQYLGDGPQDPAGPARGGRHLGKILAAAAVTVALAGGAFLAYTVFFDKSGAKSPEAAVTQMLNAVADQDGIAALRMINPGETEGFGDVYDALRKRIADAGMGSGTDGAVLEAVKIELTNLDVDVEQKGEHAARVYINDGDIKITIDESKLPEELRDLYGEIDQEILDELSNIDISDVLDSEFGSNDELFITTLKQDGRWYVSPIATAGEYILQDDDQRPLTARDFDRAAEENAPDPATSKDPEGALQVLAEAISSDSVEEIFAALPSDQVAALRPFTDVLQDEYDASEGGDLRLSDLDTDFEEIDNDLGRLTINRATVETTFDDDNSTVSIDGVCLTYTDQQEREIYDPYTGGYDYETYEEEVEDCLPEDLRNQTGIDAIWVILHKTEDGWQVDPRATLIDYATKAIENFDSTLLRTAFMRGYVNF